MSKLNHDFQWDKFDQSCFNGSFSVEGCGDVGRRIAAFRGYVGAFLDVGTGEQSRAKRKETDEEDKENPL